MHATRTPHLRPAPEPDPQLAPRVLITVEDPLARRAVEDALRAQGFSVRATTDQAAAEVLLRSYEPEILVVDPHHVLPTSSPLVQRARRNEELYLVVHGADDIARVGALRSGADEALASDCNPDEIAARCEVLLRRPKRRRPRWDPLGSNEVRLGPLSVDLGRREIQVNSHVVAATRLEFDLFAQLCRHPQEVRSRAQLLEAVWGPGWVGDTHVVDVHLSNLRRKLRQRASDLQFIHTVRGVGFRLSDDLLHLALPEMVESNNVHHLMA